MYFLAIITALSIYFFNALFMVLISELEKDGIEAIDTQSLFDYEYNRNNVMLYHNDDTHWNAKGVKVTAELIKEQIMSEE